MYFSFSNPYYLFSLFVIPLMIFFHFFSIRTQRKSSLKFANFDSIAKVKGIDLYSKNIYVLVFNVLFVILLSFSLAGANIHLTTKANAFSFVIAIDTSQSMSAEDLYPNRLDVAKKTAIGFVNSKEIGSRLGVISFSGNALIEQDITNDKQQLRTSLEGISFASFGGTDISEAIITSSNLLKGEEAKAVILLSDGQLNVGNIDDAISYARENNVLIHTIAIGTSEGGDFGYGISKVDKDTLQALAYNTQGNYYEITTQEEMSASFTDIGEVTEKVSSISLLPYLLLLSLLIFLVRDFLSSINKVSY